ncbi:hypothetical protein EVJ58_g6008 [Rhodofomes roseus]|uniref:Uncharacterized protein n=1 Tax=Rhodofomes roseus TaxID=34475 RepID=A0A4Y9Y9V1_9APHY|nr:hypothetical protein EVJ58_g6008 [Rhodofomes roseus]
MDNPQFYQPLSHALHPPLAAHHSPQQPQYAAYGAHAHTAASNGVGHTNREEEEEEDDEEDVVEDELDRNDPDHSQHPTHSPHHAAQSASAAAAMSASTVNRQEVVLQAQSQSGADGDDAAKRKPGRPRGSRNRKPKTANVTPPAPKAPLNSHHPGFYQYPPAPGSAVNPNQQFYEFQWRALNLCSEFYNAAEELVKAASPVVISQCYQMGPGARIDPLAMIADAKRVCDNLLANPSQLVGQQPPPAYPYPSSYSTPYVPPAPPATTASPSNSSTPASGSVITNPQSFVMPLGTSMPPPAHAAPNPYYSGVYAAARYPTAPYYSYPTQPHASYYPPPATPAPASAAPSAPAPTAAAPASSTSTFSAAQPSASASSSSVGQQGSWSAEEEDRLRRLAEQSREQGGPQNKAYAQSDDNSTVSDDDHSRIDACVSGITSATTSVIHHDASYHSPSTHYDNSVAGVVKSALAYAHSGCEYTVASPHCRPNRPAQHVLLPPSPNTTSVVRHERRHIDDDLVRCGERVQHDPIWRRRDFASGVVAW